jgi:hypothetical protein
MVVFRTREAFEKARDAILAKMTIGADAVLVLDDGTELPANTGVLAETFGVFAHLSECDGTHLHRMPIPGPPAIVTTVLQSALAFSARVSNGSGSRKPVFLLPPDPSSDYQVIFSGITSAFEPRMQHLLKTTFTDQVESVAALKKEHAFLFLDDFEACVRVADFLQWRLLEPFFIWRVASLQQPQFDRLSAKADAAEELYRCLEIAGHAFPKTARRAHDMCLDCIYHRRAAANAGRHPIETIRAAMAAFPEPDMRRRMDLLADLMAHCAKAGAPPLPLPVRRALCTGDDIDVDFAGESVPPHAIALGPFNGSRGTIVLGDTFDHNGHTWRFGVRQTAVTRGDDGILTSISSDDDDERENAYHSTEPILILVSPRAGVAVVDATFRICVRRFVPEPSLSSPWHHRERHIENMRRSERRQLGRYFTSADWNDRRGAAGVRQTYEHRFLRSGHHFANPHAAVPGSLKSMQRGSDPFGTVHVWVEFFDT